MYKISKNQVKYDDEGNIIISDGICEQIFERVQYTHDQGDFYYYLDRHLGNDGNFIQDAPILNHDFLRAVQDDTYLTKQILDRYCETREAICKLSLDDIFQECQEEYLAGHYEYAPDDSATDCPNDTEDEDYE